jgi:hypothetical protein
VIDAKNYRDYANFLLGQRTFPEIDSQFAQSVDDLRAERGKLPASQRRRQQAHAAASITPTRIGRSDNYEELSRDN